MTEQDDLNPPDYSILEADESVNLLKWHPAMDLNSNATTTCLRPNQPTMAWNSKKCMSCKEKVMDSAFGDADCRCDGCRSWRRREYWAKGVAHTQQMRFVVVNLVLSQHLRLSA